MSRATRNAAFLWLAAAWVCPTGPGCGPIGRELVGAFPEDTGLTTCPSPPECDDAYKEANPIELSSVELALADDLCQSRDPEPRPLSFAAIAAASGEAEVEGRDLLPGAPDISNGGQAPTRFECARLELGGGEADGGVEGGAGGGAGGAASEEVRLPGIELYATELTLSSQAPVSVVLPGARLREVSIVLRGGIVLRVERSLAFEGVQLVSEELAGQRPRIELEEIDGERLQVGSEGRPFAGVLSLARSHVERSRFFVSRVELESARMSDFALETDELEGTGASLHRARLNFRNAVLSGSALSRVEIPDCGTLTTIWSSIEQSQISACSEGPFHAYSTSVSGGFADGPIDADRAQWNDVLLGLYESTDLLGWDVTIAGSTFCQGSRSLRLGGESAVSCTDCTDAGFGRREAACIFPDTVLDAAGNSCPELDRIMLCPASSPPVMVPVR